ncbi:MAG: TonB-dependent receptor [Candidatus Aminicenantes bacterium]|nr:TonB-dependent receptor [Candidatus Aminicenantes bacterium]
MKSKKFFLTALAVLLVFSWSSATEKYGALAGIVTDEEAVPLPGVSVTVTGEYLQGERTDITNERGYFRIGPLPVAKRGYTAVFMLPGFKKVNWPRITVELGKTLDLKIVMEVTTLEEEITVIAVSPIVDTKSSTSQITISKDLVETLANDRQYQTIMAMMPGAIDANNPFMFGGSGSDNMYLFDGMDSTDPMTKTWSTAMNFDNFEEMQVVISGAPPEFGRGTGAVINVVTKSGSNTFHGLLRFHLTDVGWNAQATGGRYYFSDATHYLTEKRPSINVGGPIMPDMLWFFASWERRNKWKPGSRYENFADWIDDLEPTTGIKCYYRGHYASAKLTFKPFPNQSIMGQWMEDPIRIPLLYAYIGYSSRNDESDAVRFQGGWNLNSEWTSVFGANTFMTIRYSLKRNELNNEPVGSGTTFYRGGVYYGNASSAYFTRRYHDQVQLSLSHFAETSFGLHDLKIGAEMMDIRLSWYSQSYPGNEFIRYHYDDAATPMYRYLMPDRPRSEYDMWVYDRFWTFFIQDKWEVAPNLTLNIGLRAETMKWKNHDKVAILSWGLGKMLAPRIGVAYNLKGNKIHANFGRFYDVYGDWLIRNNQPDAFSYSYEYYRGEYYGVPTWTLIGTYTTGTASTSSYNPDIKPSYMDEFGIGYEHMLTDVISVGVDIMTRSWKRRVEDFDYGYSDAPYNNPDLDGVWHFDNATHPDWGSTYKRYRAAIISFKKNLGNDKYQFLASYTLSDLKGWESSDSDANWGDSPEEDYNALGYLPNDIRHMVKFNGNVFLPYGFNIGTTFYWTSGQPYTETATAYNPIDNRGKTYRLDERGSSGRYPPRWRIDLRLEKKFTILNKVSISAYADVFNLLNNQVEMVRDNSIGDIQLAGDQIGASYTVISPNLDYGNFTRWYPPTSFFIGVKVEF